MLFIWTAFITGLVAGGASCAAVQGGLIAGLAARRNGGDQVQNQTKAPTRLVAKNNKNTSAKSGKGTQTRTHANVTSTKPSAGVVTSQVKADAETVIVFLVGKLIAYTLLGFALGLLGQAIEITPQVQAVMLILAGLIMVVMALDLFGVKAVRSLVPSPPASWTKVVRARTKKTGRFAPFALGFATILIPCGVTISMEVAAISTGSPLLGAGIMAAFVLGTVPLFFAIGFGAQRLTSAWGGRLAAVTGVVVLGAALLAINSGLNLSGSPITLATLVGLGQDKQVAGSATTSSSGSQQITVTATSSEYTPNAITAKANVPINLILHGSNASGCIRSFTIPKLQVRASIPENGDSTVALGALEPGRYPFSCSMGMYNGSITVT